MLVGQRDLKSLTFALRAGGLKLKHENRGCAAVERLRCAASGLELQAQGKQPEDYHSGWYESPLMEQVGLPFWMALVVTYGASGFAACKVRCKVDVLQTGCCWETTANWMLQHNGCADTLWICCRQVQHHDL